MRFKIALAFLIGLFATVAWSTVAAADSSNYGPTFTTEVTTSSSTVDPCGPTSVSGSGFQPGETVTVTLQGAVIGTATVGPNGSFTATVTIPSGTPSGNYTVVSTGTSGDSSSTSLNVAGGTCGGPKIQTVSSTSGTSGLAFTGADIATMVEIAGAALGVGGLLMLAARRRRQATN